MQFNWAHIVKSL